MQIAISAANYASDSKAPWFNLVATDCAIPSENGGHSCLQLLHNYTHGDVLIAPSPPFLPARVVIITPLASSDSRALNATAEPISIPGRATIGTASDDADVSVVPLCAASISPSPSTSTSSLSPLAATTSLTSQQRRPGHYPTFWANVSLHLFPRCGAWLDVRCNASGWAEQSAVCMRCYQRLRY